MHQVNPVINAVAKSLEEEALHAADAADRALRRGGHRSVGALHGVPVTTKINVDLKGHATTNGVVAFKDAIASEDSAAVANLRQAGAVIIGRTNTPAFSFRWFTDNDLHGRTLNPWNKGLTPGGSSGGAAASVAAGIGAIGHGNDIAGSVRYPAWACGVAGIRPTVGRVPNVNPSSTAGRTITSQIMSTQGLLARRVADLRLGLDPFSSGDVRDSWWSEAPEVPRHRGPLRVGVIREAEGVSRDSVDDLCRTALDRAARALRSAGHEVEDIQLPDFTELAELWSPLVLSESLANFVPAIEKFGDAAIKNALRTWLAITDELDLAGFSAGLGRRDQIVGRWRKLLGTYDVIVTPVSWDRQFPVDHDQKGTEVFREIIRAQAPMLTMALAGVPGLAVPTGPVDGVPTGVQIVAERFREDLCFDAGEVIEAMWSPETPIDPR
jgi:amidase